MGKRWDINDFEQRTGGGANMVGFEPGTPDDREIAAYQAYVGAALEAAEGANGNALVMGMTVRVRQAMHELGLAVTCMDISEGAVNYLRNALPDAFRARETVLNDDWMNLPAALPGPVSAIVGDGVFSNILSLAQQNVLLGRLRETLVPGGALVTRNFVMAPDFPFDAFDPDRLLARYRAGELNDGEFAHGFRIFGFWNKAFDRETLLLDNKIIFEEIDNWHDDGRISEAEYRVVRQQYFGGLTIMPSQADWEEMLRRNGFTFEMTTLEGRLWYQYGPIYRCTPV